MARTEFRSLTPGKGYATIAKVDTYFDTDGAKRTAYVEAKVTGGVIPNHEVNRPQVDISVTVNESGATYDLKPQCTSVENSLRQRNRLRVRSGKEEFALQSSDYPTIQDTLEAIGLEPEDLASLQRIVWTARRRLGKR
jgi:hypothetical protein